MKYIIGLIILLMPGSIIILIAGYLWNKYKSTKQQDDNESDTNDND